LQGLALLPLSVLVLLLVPVPVLVLVLVQCPLCSSFLAY
jgi:hypothetical protein